MIKIILSALNDDHGVSEETYHEILASLKMLGLHDFRDFLESHVNATDGRFYLEHDHSHEVTAWSV